ncbi:hypothetical protein HDU80_009964 [Chytriomyces hyalinus]|nr:hypothetical protein HDU80_009964 [Chytriomyces hyalinus]
MTNYAVALAPVPCDSCRARRVKCDRRVPECDRCHRRRDGCNYRNKSVFSSDPANLISSDATPVKFGTLEETLFKVDGHLTHNDSSHKRIAVACTRCRDAKRKCNAMRPSCGQCSKKGLACEYVACHSTRSKNSPRDASSEISEGTGSRFCSGSSDKDSVLSISFSPANSSGMLLSPVSATSLANPDLMPTIQECMMVYQYVSSDYLAVDMISFYLVDMDQFLRTFSFQPAGLRLAYCAIAAASLRRRDKQQYYDRAEKALFSDNAPIALSTVQALLAISKFGLLAGTELAPYFLQACELISLLQLDIDPDNLPHSSLLTESEKEERRCVFHVWFALYTQGKSVTPFALPPQTFDFNNVRPAKNKRMTALNMNFPQSSVAHICHASALLDVAGDIRAFWEAPPTSVTRVLHCETIHALEQKLERTMKRMRETSVTTNSASPFISLSSVQITRENVSNLFPHMSDLIIVNLYHNAAICMLYRPQVYLSRFLSLSSTHLQDNRDNNMTVILNAINTTMNAARNILDLSSWMYHHPLYKTLWIPKFYRDHCTVTFALFEACIVAWFLTCRTQHYWWWTTSNDSNGFGNECASSLLSMTLEDRAAIRAGVSDIVNTFGDLDQLFDRKDGVPNMISPLFRFSKAMLEEMKDVEDLLRCASSSPSVDVQPQQVKRESDVGGSVDALVAEMDGLCVLESGNVLGQETWVFLNLLGVSVGKGHLERELFWDAPNAQNWKTFWTLASMQ